MTGAPGAVGADGAGVVGADEAGVAATGVGAGCLIAVAGACTVVTDALRGVVVAGAAGAASAAGAATGAVATAGVADGAAAVEVDEDTESDLVKRTDVLVALAESVTVEYPCQWPPGQPWWCPPSTESEPVDVSLTLSVVEAVEELEDVESEAVVEVDVAVELGMLVDDCVVVAVLEIAVVVVTLEELVAVDVECVAVVVVLPLGARSMGPVPLLVLVAVVWVAVTAAGGTTGGTTAGATAGVVSVALEVLDVATLTVGAGAAGVGSGAAGVVGTVGFGVVDTGSCPSRVDGAWRTVPAGWVGVTVITGVLTLRGPSGVIVAGVAATVVPAGGARVRARPEGTFASRTWRAPEPVTSCADWPLTLGAGATRVTLPSL